MPDSQVKLKKWRLCLVHSVFPPIVDWTSYSCWKCSHDPDSLARQEPTLQVLTPTQVTYSGMSAPLQICTKQWGGTHLLLRLLVCHSLKTGPHRKLYWEEYICVQGSPMPDGPELLKAPLLKRDADCETLPTITGWTPGHCTLHWPSAHYLYEAENPQFRIFG